MSLTRQKAIAGIVIIIVGIVLSSIGYAFTSQTPETETGTDEGLEGFAQWAKNVGITFVKGLGIGFTYLGFIVIIVGVASLIIWQIKS